MSITSEQLVKLKELAKKATHGPWEAQDFTKFAIVHDCALREIAKVYCYKRSNLPPPPCRDNAAFIAAANPQTVLALIAEIERLKVKVGESD